MLIGLHSALDIFSSDFFVLSAPAFGHSGRLNAQGCHNDRKHGTYHCHTKNSSKPKASKKIKSQKRPPKVANNPNQSALQTRLPQFILPQQEVYYKDCIEVQKAGASPLKKGEPGYRIELDPNHDDVACDL
jgi:hypothetical protein